MKSSSFTIACIAVFLSVVCLSTARAQRNQWSVEPPRQMTLDRALEQLGIPLRNADKILKLTDAQKKAIIKAAEELQDQLVRKIIETVGGQTETLLKNYQANAGEFGPDLGLLELTDPQKTKLRKLLVAYKKGRGSSSRNVRSRAWRTFNSEVKKLLTKPQLEIIAKVQAAKARP